MSDPLMSALLGHDPAFLTEDASLATLVTSPRITGRDAVVAALCAYAEIIGAPDADRRLEREEFPRRLRLAPNAKGQLHV
jgi:hypothetical protein